jgi:hypothetical protein
MNLLGHRRGEHFLRSNRLRRLTLSRPRGEVEVLSVGTLNIGAAMRLLLCLVFIAMQWTLIGFESHDSLAHWEAKIPAISHDAGQCNSNGQTCCRICIAVGRWFDTPDYLPDHRAGQLVLPPTDLAVGINHKPLRKPPRSIA